ncbi:hypothetical protein HAX54_036532 [Datura stramonium]|uniref:Uncharacterized protein n=1 Tax=Datura stramonium TaxID=4076 RepID=A0ABS8SG70_DATST|nr:hypothetical protein [Datura stramonium]
MEVEEKPEEILPLDVKDYEDLGLIIELDEGETSFERSNIDFNTLFSDFPFDEEKEIDFYPDREILPADDRLSELEKWMELNYPDQREFIDIPGYEDDTLMDLGSWMGINYLHQKEINHSAHQMMNQTPEKWIDISPPVKCDQGESSTGTSGAAAQNNWDFEPLLCKELDRRDSALLALSSEQ